MDNKQGMNVGGRFDFQLVRDGEIIEEWSEDNIVVNEGLNHLLNSTFHGAAQATTWYCGLFEANYTPVATDTASNIATNATESTAYDETTRPEWVEAAAASQSITNAANKALFTMNETKSIYGAFLVSSNTKGGTSGVLFAATRFAAVRNVVATDQLLVTYTLEAQSV